MQRSGDLSDLNHRIHRQNSKPYHKTGRCFSAAGCVLKNGQERLAVGAIGGLTAYQARRQAGEKEGTLGRGGRGGRGGWG